MRAVGSPPQSAVGSESICLIILIAQHNQFIQPHDEHVTQTIITLNIVGVFDFDHLAFFPGGALNLLFIKAAFV